MTVVGADLFGGTAKVDAWVDFNQDGVFDATTERVTPAAGADVVNGTNLVTFAVPGGAVLGDTFARVRLSSAGGLNPDGEAVDGEVEDYQVTIAEPPATVYVDETWAGTTIGTAPPGPATAYGYDAFAIIQDGVDMVAADGTVNIAEGNYGENLVIEKSLSLDGGWQRHGNRWWWRHEHRDYQFGWYGCRSGRPHRGNRHRAGSFSDRGD